MQPGCLAWPSECKYILDEIDRTRKIPVAVPGGLCPPGADQHCQLSTDVTPNYPFSFNDEGGQAREHVGRNLGVYIIRAGGRLTPVDLRSLEKAGMGSTTMAAKGSITIKQAFEFATQLGIENIVCTGCKVRTVFTSGNAATALTRHKSLERKIFLQKCWVTKFALQRWGAIHPLTET